jgi:myo-inositol-1(or 4)-monophosphatase
MPATDWLKAAEAALDAAGAAIKPYFRAGVAAEQKLDESPVTIADRTAEEIIRATLAEAFPYHGLLGEEFPAHNADARYVWAIDPIDGTRAFITGRPSFCTLLGLFEDGEPILGLIDQPITGERWIGGRAIPAQFRNPLGGKPGTSQVKRLAEAELSSTAPEMFVGDGLARFSRLKSQCRRVYWGGDAYAYGLLALGQVDIVAESGLKTWDWGALAPVIEAAGGIVTDWSGQKLRLGAEGTVLAAANATLHAAALAALK